MYDKLQFIVANKKSRCGTGDKLKSLSHSKSLDAALSSSHLGDDMAKLAEACRFV
jgi:hypothetical protein